MITKTFSLKQTDNSKLVNLKSHTIFKGYFSQKLLKVTMFAWMIKFNSKA